MEELVAFARLAKRMASTHANLASIGLTKGNSVLHVGPDMSPI